MSSRLHRGGASIEVLCWELSPKLGTQAVCGRDSAAPSRQLPAMDEDGGAGDLERQAEARAQAAYQRGLREGDASARQQAEAQIDSALEDIGNTVAELARLKPHLRHEAEEDVVKLAMAISRRILHREISTDPEALLGLVRAALDKLDGREIHRIRANPLDAPILENHFQTMFRKLGLSRKIEVFADTALRRGAAIFETAHGALDASVDTQLQEIERGFADLMRKST
jgi:flagellar assembly protein FliH